MPELAGVKLFGFPAQAFLLQISKLICLVPQELGIPFGHAEFPGHFGAAKGPNTLVPAAVHHPIPGDRDAIFA